MAYFVARWAVTALTVAVAATAFLVGYLRSGQAASAVAAEPLPATLPPVPLVTREGSEPGLAGIAYSGPGHEGPGHTGPSAGSNVMARADFAGDTGGLPPTGTAPAARDAPRLLAVHVAGAVHEPGVHWVPEGARVNDAVVAAGGARADGVPHALNLAAPVRDGEKIYVPAEQELEDQMEVAPALGADHAPRQSAQAPGSRLEAADPGRLLVNINRAGVQELTALPGIGPALAQRIVAYRAQVGQFRQVDDLLGVSGIGPKTLERLRPHLTI